MDLTVEITQHVSASSHRVLDVTAADAARLLAALPDGATERELPGSAAHAYLDALIVKPWGHELRVYDDRWTDIWRLAIEPGKGTSLHAHPRKDTCVVCIGGAAVLTTGAGDEIPLAEGSVVHIRAGALHETFAEGGADLLEVELPRDKFDLVRIDDRYGRAGQRYEGAAASRREPCRLDPCPTGPPQARLRRHCATGCFRFNLESAGWAQRSARDLVVAIPLETRSMLKRDLRVLTSDALAAVNDVQMLLTVRSNHR